MQTTRIRFVDNVVVQVIERQLVSKMTDIFSASRTSKMADDEVKLMTKVEWFRRYYLHINILRRACLLLIIFTAGKN